MARPVAKRLGGPRDRFCDHVGASLRDAGELRVAGRFDLRVSERLAYMLLPQLARIGQFPSTSLIAFTLKNKDTNAQIESYNVPNALSY